MFILFYTYFFKKERAKSKKEKASSLPASNADWAGVGGARASLLGDGAGVEGSDTDM